MLSKVLAVMCDFHSELGFNQSEASVYFKDNKKYISTLIRVLLEG